MAHVMMLSERGMPLGCETEGCGLGATSAWSDGYGPSRRACDAHNPMANIAMSLPWNFTNLPVCHACGQPVSVSSLITP